MGMILAQVQFELMALKSEVQTLMLFLTEKSRLNDSYITNQLSFSHHLEAKTCYDINV